MHPCCYLECTIERANPWDISTAFVVISLIAGVNADHGGVLLSDYILSAFINSTTEAYPSLEQSYVAPFMIY